MLIKLSRRPVKSGYSDVEKALNELEDYFDRGADGDTIYTHISHDDENHIAKVCEEHNVDFSVGSNHVTLYPIESSRRLIKSSFVIEHWNPLLPQTQYVGYNDEGLAGVYDINDALQFNTKEEAKQFIKEHDEEYGGKLKIHEYPSYVQNSRRPVESSFIVGKQDNGNKVYFCEDGLYYSENDYARPSIKIFDNKREADKIAKRSKSGFVIPF